MQREREVAVVSVGQACPACLPATAMSPPACPCLSCLPSRPVPERRGQRGVKSWEAKAVCSELQREAACVREERREQVEEESERKRVCVCC